MSERFVQSQIKRMLLFERLPEDQLQLISGAFQVLRFEPGAVVFREGQAAQGLFYFVSGRAVLTHWEPNSTGQTVEVPIGEVGQNQFLGENALFTQAQEHATLHIVESAVVLFLSRQSLASLVMARPELRLNLGLQHGDSQGVVKPLFKGQRSDEVVLQIFRRHWWSYARYAWIPLGLTTGLMVGSVLLGGPTVLTLGLSGLTLIFGAGLMYYLYTEWQDDSIIVTDQRVVRILNLWLGIQNSISEIPLDRVQEVSIITPQGDPFARWFSYGTVNVRTAGGIGNVSMTVIPHPTRVRDLIFEYREQVRRSVTDQSRREVDAEINRVLGLAVEGGPTGAVLASQSLPAEPQKDPGFSLNLLRTCYTDDSGNTVYRKHYTVWLAHVLPPLLVLLLSVALAGAAMMNALPGYNGPALGIALLTFIFGCVWGYLADWDWRNDQFIISDDTIRLIRKRPLWLQDEVDQIRLDKIDSVVSSVRGILNNVLDRGDVLISLLGDDQPKTMSAVPNPKSIQGEISQRLSQRRLNERKSYVEGQREAITEYLAAYHEKVSGAQPRAQAADDYTLARDVSPLPPQSLPEAPPKPIRDGVRPPRVPRMRPGE